MTWLLTGLIGNLKQKALLQIDAQSPKLNARSHFAEELRTRGMCSWPMIGLNLGDCLCCRITFGGTTFGRIEVRRDRCADDEGYHHRIPLGSCATCESAGYWEPKGRCPNSERSSKLEVRQDTVSKSRLCRSGMACL